MDKRLFAVSNPCALLLLLLLSVFVTHFQHVWKSCDLGSVRSLRQDNCGSAHLHGVAAVDGIWLKPRAKLQLQREETDSNVNNRPFQPQR